MEACFTFGKKVYQQETSWIEKALCLSREPLCLKRESLIEFIIRPDRIFLGTVDLMIFQIVQDGPNCIFSGGSVILTKKAMFSSQQLLGFFQTHFFCVSFQEIDQSLVSCFRLQSFHRAANCTSYSSCSNASISFRMKRNAFFRLRKTALRLMLHILPISSSL